jgi:hypothetical protein
MSFHDIFPITKTTPQSKFPSLNSAGILLADRAAAGNTVALAAKSDRAFGLKATQWQIPSSNIKII